MAGALQRRVGPVARGQDVDVGMQLVGPGQRRATRAMVTAWPQPVPPSAVIRW